MNMKDIAVQDVLADSGLSMIVVFLSATILDIVITNYLKIQEIGLFKVYRKDRVMRLEIVKIYFSNSVSYEIHFIPNNGKFLRVGSAYKLRRDAERTARSLTKFLKNVDIKI